MIKTGYQSPAVDGGEADRQRAAEADAVEVSHEGNDHAPGLEEGEGLRGEAAEVIVERIRCFTRWWFQMFEIFSPGNFGEDDPI